MIAHDGVKIRKIIYGKKGFQQGVLLPIFAGDINESFDHYSKLWFKDHSDKDGNIFDYIPAQDVEYMDEFTIKDTDYFYIGLPNTYAYEGVGEEYEGYPGCELDEYGFEKMIDLDGNIIPYFDEKL